MDVLEQEVHLKVQCKRTTEDGLDISGLSVSHCSFISLVREKRVSNVSWCPAEGARARDCSARASLNLLHYTRLKANPGYVPNRIPL